MIDHWSPADETPVSQLVDLAQRGQGFPLAPGRAALFLFRISLFLSLLGSLQSVVRAQVVRYDFVKGKIRIEGTSNLDDWQVESKSIRGYFEASKGFLERSPQVTPGQKVDARAQVLIPVGTLKSVEKDGKPFSNRMDEILHAKLKAEQHPMIQYRLIDLIVKAPPKTLDEACRCESRGELVVAGATNQVTMPVSLMPADHRHLRVSGQTSVRMTDFQIEPPAPKIALGVVKTGDEVRLSFEWDVVESGRPHSGAATESLPR